jgi:hypothetical protein
MNERQPAQWIAAVDRMRDYPHPRTRPHRVKLRGRNEAAGRGNA